MGSIDTSVALIGIEGVGKTIVGKYVASKLGIPFLNLTQLYHSFNDNSQSSSMQEMRLNHKLKYELSHQKVILECAPEIIDTPSTIQTIKDNAYVLHISPGRHYNSAAEMIAKRRLASKEYIARQLESTHGLLDAIADDTILTFRGSVELVGNEILKKIS